MRKVILVGMVLSMLITGCGSGTSPKSSADITPQTLDATDSRLEPADYTRDEDADEQEDGDYVQIKEKLFITQINEIYLNREDYLGEKIKLEGMFFSYYYENTDLTYYTVLRYGPGCCGNDANAGFEVVWDDEDSKVYPEDNDWVEAIGVLEVYEEDGNEYLRLRLTSLEVKEERGEETVAM